jgi:hypothetical protein
VAWGVLIALTLVLLVPGVALADQENYYLGPDGVPQAQLMLNPLGGEMPNYDRGRDVEPGLLLHRSTRGLTEDDPTRYQQWQMDLSGQRLVGYPSMVVWSAADGFEAGQHGVFTVYILDCDASGGDCERLGSRTATMDSGAGGAWVETIVDFSSLDHTFGQGRNLAVRIVVPSASEADLMFAYGYTTQRSRLTMHSDKPETVIDGSAAGPSMPSPADLVGASPHASTAVAEAAAAPSEPAFTEPASSETAPETSFWPWLITLALSTAGLVGVGLSLMSSLTPPDRHQHPGAPAREDRGQRRRISVSAP